MSDYEVVVALKADLQNLSTNLKEASDKIGKFGSTSIASGVAIGITFSEMIGKVIDFGKASVQQFEQSQLAMTRLAFFVGNDAAHAFDEYAQSLEQTTTFSRDSILALESQLTSYGVLPGSIKQATRALLDYAAATGKDLPEAGTVFARAIQGQSRELKQYGLQLNASDSQGEHMTQTVAFLTDRFGGMAQTIKGTVVGQIDTLKNKLDALKEAAGKDIVDAIGFWGGALRSVAGALGISEERVKALTNAMSGNASVRQLAIDKLTEERTQIIIAAQNIAEMSKTTVQLTEAQQKRIKGITDEINALKKQESQEKKTADEGKRGVKVVQSQAQQAVAERIAGMRLEMDTNTEVENHIQEITTATTNLKIQKSFMELQQIQADQGRITEITNIETEKRLETSRQSWEAQASFSDQFKVKLADDLSKSTEAFSSMAYSMIGMFADSTARMIVEGGKFSQVIQNLWKSIAEAVISQIIRMIAEWIIWQSMTGGAGGIFGGFMADGGMINEPSVLTGLRTGTRHMVGEAGPEAVVPMSGNRSGLPAMAAASSGGGGGGGDINIHITGQFLEGSASKWQRMIQEQIAPEIRRVAMKDPNSLITRKRGSLS